MTVLRSDRVILKVVEGVSVEWKVTTTRFVVEGVSSIKGGLFLD